MTTRQTKRLTIFEGPDGAGKSTIARAYAEQTGARYVHFGPLLHVTTGLMRMHAEAMLPAVLGYQDVVFDRSWLSEYPYSTVFRGGRDRMGPVYTRMLERLALRCGGAVVLCLPEQSVAVDNYIRRRDAGGEYLQKVEQLEKVYDIYTTLKASHRQQDPRYRNSLPTVVYNYEDYHGESIGITAGYLVHQLEMMRTWPHDAESTSAGNANAPIVLVSGPFSEHGNLDTYHQWPFSDYSKAGSSWWLSYQLCKTNVDEIDLYWRTTDRDLSFLQNSRHKIIALGHMAETALMTQITRPFAKVDHPEHWSRVRSCEPYPLLSLLQGVV